MSLSHNVSACKALEEIHRVLGAAEAKGDVELIQQIGRAVADAELDLDIMRRPQAAPSRPDSGIISASLARALACGLKEEP